MIQNSVFMKAVYNEKFQVKSDNREVPVLKAFWINPKTRRFYGDE